MRPQLSNAKMTISTTQKRLVLGDAVALGLVTLTGFATHGEAGLAYLPRMLTTYLPLLAAWFGVSPWLELFNAKSVCNLRMLWRVPMAVLLAAPLAGVLRAVLLNSVVLPLFVLILGSAAALVLFMWRIIFIKIYCK